MADGVNVNDDVVRIKTEVTDAGSKVEAVYRLQELDEFTRARRDGQFDDDFEFSPRGTPTCAQRPPEPRRRRVGHGRRREGQRL